MKHSLLLYNNNNSNNTSNNNIDIYNLPDYLKSVLIGLMLGDGSLYKSSPTSNTRLEMSFGSGDHYQLFAENIELLFKDYISNPLKLVEIKGKNNVYSNYRLKTRSLPLFNSYYDLFYITNTLNNGNTKRIKIVPTNILELLDPIVLAYLIMGDGSYNSNSNRVRIYTNSFTKQEVELLASSIYNKFNLYTGVLHDRNDQ
jgi:LAGLIDADG DNA endonuclease family